MSLWATRALDTLHTPPQYRPRDHARPRAAPPPVPRHRCSSGACAARAATRCTWTAAGPPAAGRTRRPSPCSSRLRPRARRRRPRQRRATATSPHPGARRPACARRGRGAGCALSPPCPSSGRPQGLAARLAARQHARDRPAIPACAAEQPSFDDPKHVCAAQNPRPRRDLCVGMVSGAGRGLAGGRPGGPALQARAPAARVPCRGLLMPNRRARRASARTRLLRPAPRCPAQAARPGPHACRRMCIKSTVWCDVLDPVHLSSLLLLADLKHRWRILPLALHMQLPR